MTKKNTISILIVIILAGAFLRFYNLGSTSLVADEFLDLNSSMAYAKTGAWQNWDFNFGKINTENEFAARDERAWPYKWQVAQVLKIAKVSEGTARAVSAIWGIISIILIYYVATYFTKKKEIGLIAAFLFAVSITGIIFDRRLRMYAMFFPVYLAFSWMMYRFLEEEYKGKIKVIRTIYDKIGVNPVYFLPMFILGVISILTHQLTGNIVIAFFVYALIMAVGQWRKNKINKYTLGIGLLVLGFLGGLLVIPRQVQSFTAGIKFFTSHWSYIGNVFSDFSNLILAVAFLVSGTYYLSKQEKLSRESLWLSVSFWAILFSAIFLWNRNAGDQYIFFIESFSIILIAAGIYALAWFSSENLAKFGKKTLYFPLILTFLILPNWGYFFESSNAYHQTSESSNPNYKKIFYYFNKSRNSQDVLITRNFRNFYWTGAKIKVYDFGGELNKHRLSVEDVQNIQDENLSGWFIISDNDTDYISNDTLDYVSKNMEHVSNVYVRGSVSVYRWGNAGQ